MARRTLWDLAFTAPPNEVSVGRSFAAFMMIVAFGLFCIGLIVALAIWCWSQHWLLGAIATICPLVGLYNYVTKDPTP